MRSGDRVVVTNCSHPHYGEAGILEPSVTFLFPWQVASDEGLSFCVDTSDVVVLERPLGQDKAR